ncbi:hypothetical protein C8J57DRAFT_643100 [Mycena rebaudengoi]|nr:hypothetical protein C8J57DRAFT_643100 [Mycena rebaudengoi]
MEKKNEYFFVQHPISLQVQFLVLDLGTSSECNRAWNRACRCLATPGVFTTRTSFTSCSSAGFRKSQPGIFCCYHFIGTPTHIRISSPCHVASSGYGRCPAVWIPTRGQCGDASIASRCSRRCQRGFTVPSWYDPIGRRNGRQHRRHSKCQRVAKLPGGQVYAESDWIARHPFNCQKTIQSRNGSLTAVSLWFPICR